MEEQDRRVLNALAYAIDILLILLTISISYQPLQKNLSKYPGLYGWHTLLFVGICVLMILACIYIIMRIWKNNITAGVHIVGIALCVLPCVFYFISVYLNERASTGLEYLIQQTMWAFFPTFLPQATIACMGYFVILMKKYSKWGMKFDQ